MRAFIASNILIWHLRGERKAFNFLKRLELNQSYEFWIGAMQRAEIVFVMRSGEEEATLLFLSQFKTAAIDQIIVDHAVSLYRMWNHSHGTDINDALLAATAMYIGGTIFSLNYKHYPMPEVTVQKAW